MLIPILAVCCFVPVAVALLALFASVVAVARSLRAPSVKAPLVAAFDAMCKKELQRHEKLFQFLRRVQELEQLERGFRVYRLGPRVHPLTPCSSAISFSASSPLPTGASPYLGVLQHSARLALHSSAIELQRVCAFLAGAAGDTHRHLLPPLVPLAMDTTEEPTSHVLRQWAQQVCAARSTWMQCLMVVGGT